MERIDMVEKLREKASVSYEEAKAALEAADWDMLDAMVLLEQQGKVDQEQAPPVAAYTTKRQAPPPEEDAYYEGPRHRRNRGDGLGRFFTWCGKIVHKGNTNYVNVMQNGEKKLGLPVTAFVLLLIFAFPFMIAFLVVSLFLGISYEFVGPELGKEEINEVIHKASEAAESMKEEFQEKYEAKKEESTAKKAEKQEK